MWETGFTRARRAKTTVQCKHCETPMDIERTCHEVSMFCPKCNKKYTLAEYISKADDAVEHFLEGVYCDRM